MSELVGMRCTSSVPMASNPRSTRAIRLRLPPTPSSAPSRRRTRRGSSSCTAAGGGAPGRAASSPSPIANQNDVARWGFGLPASAHAVSGDVEQLVLLGDVEVERRARHARRPTPRRCAPSWGRWCRPSARAARLHGRRADGQHGLGDLLPRPHPLHDRDPLGHAPASSASPGPRRRRRSPRACRRRRCRRSAARR